jgi:alkaline phosphatase D
MIWDDHEIMDGWGSYTKDERKKLLNKLLQIDNEATNDRLIKLMYSAAKRVYLEYQHSHNPDTNIFLNEEDNPKCEWDYGFKVGEAAFYVFDMRGHHDYERDKKGNALLGDLQMKRFFAWLKSDPVRSASAVFIVSPVPVIHWNKFVMNFDVGPMKDDLRDEWDHKSNVKERKKLLDAVMGFSKKNKCPITFLSGDVHSASVYQIENDDRYRGAKVFSVTSSAISRKPAPSKAELLIKKSGGIKNYTGGTAHRLYALAGQNNFLMVSVDFTQDEASVSVDLCWPSGDDRELTRKRIKLS